MNYAKNFCVFTKETLVDIYDHRYLHLEVFVTTFAVLFIGLLLVLLSSGLRVWSEPKITLSPFEEAGFIYEDHTPMASKDNDLPFHKHVFMDLRLHCVATVIIILRAKFSSTSIPAASPLSLPLQPANGREYSSAREEFLTNSTGSKQRHNARKMPDGHDGPKDSKAGGNYQYLTILVSYSQLYFTHISSTLSLCYPPNPSQIW